MHRHFVGDLRRSTDAGDLGSVYFRWQLFLLHNLEGKICGEPMTVLVALVASLSVAWTVRKLIAGKPGAQREDLRTIPFESEWPRALSYTEMMNSGQQRMVETPQGDD